MDIEKMKAFAQAQRESEESTEIRPDPKPAEPEYQPEAIYIPIEDDEPSEIPDDGFAAVSNEEERNCRKQNQLRTLSQSAPGG